MPNIYSSKLLIQANYYRWQNDRRQHHRYEHNLTVQVKPNMAESTATKAKILEQVDQENKTKILYSQLATTQRTVNSR